MIFIQLTICFNYFYSINSFFMIFIQLTIFFNDLLN